MGNHDNDPYFADDFAAEHAYNKALGPTYYSLNIGGIHYIALDNIVYLNTGGFNGNIGQMNYRLQVTDRQLEWLKKDLATVDVTTPIVVWMHAPLLNSKRLNVIALSNFIGQEELVACFDNYETLILSGHQRSEERRVGKECTSWGRTWWPPYR